MENSCFTRQKATIYILSLFVSGGVIGLFGVISRIKKPMGDQMHFSDTLLGILDSLIFTGSMFGFVYLLLAPPRKLILSSFLSAFLGIVLLELIYIGTLVSFGNILIMIGMIGYGFTRAFAAVHLTIINHHFCQTQTEKYAAQIWFSLILLGDVVGILSIDFLINHLHIYWGYSLSIILGLFAIIVILFFILVKEIQLPQPIREQSIFVELKESIVSYLGNKSNLLHAFQYIFLMSSYHILLIWLPYYFLKSGFTFQAAWIAIVYPIAFILGTFAFNPIVNLFWKWYPVVIFLFLFINTFAIFLLTRLGSDVSQIPLYVVAIFCAAFFSSGVTSRITTKQISQRTNNNRAYFMAVTQMRFIIRIVLIPSGVIAGWLMQKQLHNLFYLLLTYSSISLLIFIIRWIMFPAEMKHQLQIAKEHQKIDEQEEIK